MKTGDKVVYIGGCSSSMMRCPKVDTEVCDIIARSDDWPTPSFRLKGYEFAIDGNPQWFDISQLRKVEPKKQESISESLVEELKENPEWTEKVPMERVFDLNTDF